MATVHVSLGPVGAYSLAMVPVFAGACRSETITSSGTAAFGALRAKTGDIAQIVCASAVIASVKGAASASNGVYVPANVPTYIAMAEGDAVSVIDVS